MKPQGPFHNAPAQALLARMTSIAPEDTTLFAELGEDAELLLDTLTHALPPEPMPATARPRLLNAINPYEPFVDRLVALFQVGSQQVRSYLDALTNPDAWGELVPGIRLQHVAGGAQLAGADVGFVDVAPALDFPPHLHGGEERNLVIAGSLIEQDGTIYRAGDYFTHAPGSHHAFRTGPDGVRFAVVAWDVRFGAGIEVHPEED